MSLPAAAGLTTTQVSSVWGAEFNNNGLYQGTYFDDAVGSRMDSETGNNPNWVSFTMAGDNTQNKTVYITSDSNTLNQKALDLEPDPNVNFTLEGSIETALGTEYIYKAILTAGQGLNEFNVSGTSTETYYVRFWDGDPAIPNNTAPGVTINSMNLRT
jgi:hypothetical protein